jgi:phage-related protein
VAPLGQRVLTFAKQVFDRVSQIANIWWTRVMVIVARANRIIEAIRERIRRTVEYIRERIQYVQKVIKAQITWAFGVLRSIAVKVHQTAIQPIIAAIRVIVDAIRAEIARLASIARQVITYLQQQVKQFRVSSAANVFDDSPSLHGMLLLV